MKQSILNQPKVISNTSLFSEKYVTKLISMVIIIISLLYSLPNARGALITDFNSNDTKGTSYLHKRVSVEFNEVQLREALSHLTTKYNIHLIYDDNIIPDNYRLSLSLEKVPVNIVLRKILQGTGIEFVVSEGDHVILSKVSNIRASKKYTISGYIFDVESGEALIGGNIYIENSRAGCISNDYGFYSLTIPSGNYTIVYSYIGYEIKKEEMQLNQNIKKNIELAPSIFAGDTIVVTAAFEDNFIENTEIGSIKLSPKNLSSIPVLFGEQDILKTLQLLPGVTLTREGDSGFHVRGGNSDQNLVLLDEAPVYNAFHFFGFFSVFNSDAIKDVKLIKGSAPPKYGGRLSSVLDIQMNEGNFKKFRGNGGVGLIFSRLTLEGPIVEDKSSYMVSGRRTYADVFTLLAPEDEMRKSSLYFYDFNLKTNYRLSQNDRLYISGYFGRDVLGFSGVFRNSWGNETATVRWNHLFNNKLFLNSSLIFSNFNYSMIVEPEEGTDDDDSVEITNAINAITIKEDFQYFMNARNTFNFGLQYIFYSFLPGKMSVTGDTDFNFEIGESTARDGAVYAAHEFEATERLKINYGLRYSRFSVGRLGDSYSFIDTDDIPDIDLRKSEDFTFNGLEPRFTANYKWNKTTSFKLGYSRNYQNVHLLSNSTSGTPLDVWRPSSSKVKPQRADQVSLGYFRNIENNTYELAIEIFYKNMKNQVDFKNGANLFFSTLFEADLTFGSGRSYGIEFLLKKRLGKLTGWVGYSLSKSEKIFREVNQGKPFPPKFDRTHDFSIVTLYKFNPKWTLAANWIYYTGNAITIPYGKYKINGIILDAYTERNAYRMPAYHRLDISLTYTTNGGNSWNFSLYNAYGRKNAYAILFQDGKPDPIKLSLFSFLPSISYNFKF